MPKLYAVCPGGEEAHLKCVGLKGLAGSNPVYGARKEFQMKKICAYCKKEFETPHKNAKYCSRQCTGFAVGQEKREQNLQK